MKIDTPCHGCKTRKVGCHGECPAYRAWTEIHNREVERRRQIREMESFIPGVRHKKVKEPKY